MPTRVLRLIARLNVGGPAQHVTWLCPEMARRGFATLLAAGFVGPEEEEHTPVLERHGVRPLRVPELGREIRPIPDLLALMRILRVLYRFRPDVVHTHTAKAGFLGRAAAILYRLTTRRRVAVFHTFHGHVFEGYFGRARTALFLFLERALARATDALLVLSPAQARDLSARYRVAPPERFRIVPLGIDLAPFLAAGRPAEDPGRHPLVGWVGRLVPVKAPHLFLDAAALVEADARFLVVGDGHLRHELEPRVEGSRVTLAGTRHDLPAVYAGIDLLVLTSRNEGTPVAILEAFAAGVPVVSTAVGGVPDLLADGRGVLVPPGDAKALARAIDDLLADPARRREIARRARDYVVATHSLAALGDRVEAVYREFLR